MINEAGTKDFLEGILLLINEAKAPQCKCRITRVFRFVQRRRQPGSRFMAVCLKTKVPIDLDEVDAGGTLVERVCDISIFRGACVACRLQQFKCSLKKVNI